MPSADKTEHRRITRRQFLRGAAAGALLAAAVPGYSHSGERQGSSAGAGPTILHSFNTRARKVCLTYDDMWSEYYVERIARAYARRGVRLTLFPAGLAVHNNLERPRAGYEHLYPRLRDMGHEFGCHLYTHRDIRRFSLQQLQDEEFGPALAVMRRALGADFQPLGIRPPYGSISPALQELAARQGLPLVLWQLDSQDARCYKAFCSASCQELPKSSHEFLARQSRGLPLSRPCSEASCTRRCTEAILANYAQYLRPGSIILHHAIKPSYLAVDATLDFLQSWNLQPALVSEMLGAGAL